MQSTLQKLLEKLNIWHKQRSRWYKIVTVLASIAVFVTTYVMILPAITWDSFLICEIEEHIHDEQCYDESGILICAKQEHVHDDSCYDAPAPEESIYICGKTEHEHTEDCYFSDGTLHCTLEEHTHTEDCLNQEIETPPQMLLAAPRLLGAAGPLGAAPSEYSARTGNTGITVSGSSVDTIKEAYTSDPTTSHIEEIIQSAGKANDGRVVTDKSVVYNGDQFDVFDTYDEDEFSVALSAIGQGYDLTAVYELKQPMDIVYVVDISSSMLRQNTDDSRSSNITGNGLQYTRAYAAMVALNKAIDAVMSNNPNNRVSVILYNSSAIEFLPLASYKNDSVNITSNPFKYLQMTNVSSGYYANIQTVSGLQQKNGETYITFSKTQNYTSQNDWGGTYTQAGIKMAETLFLDNADDKDVVLSVDIDMGDGVKTTIQKTVSRKPVLVLLTDGLPTYYSTQYDVDNPTRSGSGREPDDSGNAAIHTIRQAKLSKDKITRAYSTDGASNNTIFYTIGMGRVDASESNNALAQAIINPVPTTLDNLDDFRNISDDNYSRILYTALQNDTAYQANPYYYAYADGSQAGTFDASELAEHLSEFITTDEVTHLYGIILKTLTRVDITDEIGDGMVMKTDPVLIMGEKQYTPSSSSASGNVTTYYYDYSDITIEEKDDEGNMVTTMVTATVTEDASGHQTVKLTVPDSLLPLREPILTSKDDTGEYQYTDTTPVRLVYKVGLSEDSKEDVDTLYGTDKSLTYYTNEYENNDAYSEYWPLGSNPYYGKSSGYDMTSKPKTQNATGTLGNAVTFDTASSTSTYVKQYLGNNGKLVFTSEYMPYVSAKIIKVDPDGNKITSGTAEFSIYEDSECEHIVGTYPTVNGEIVISEADKILRANKKYYVKEITAPTIYQVFSSVKEVELNEDGEFLITSDGHYSVDEDGALVVKNEYQTVEKTVQKRWVDSKGQELQEHPESVQVRLYADGVAQGDPITLNSSNNWSYTWQNLVKWDIENETVINYTVAELRVSDGYVAVTRTAENGNIIIDNIKKGETELSVYKKWDGGQLHSVTVDLYQTVKGVKTKTDKSAVLNEANGWYFRFTGLPDIDEEGNVIKYSVEERTVIGFTKDEHLYTPGEESVYTGHSETTDSKTRTATTTFENDKDYILVIGGKVLSSVSTDDMDILNLDVEYTNSLEITDNMLWTVTVSGSGNSTRYTFTNKAAEENLTFFNHSSTRRYALGNPRGYGENEIYTSLYVETVSNTNKTVRIRYPINSRDYYLSDNYLSTSDKYGYTYLDTNTNSGYAEPISPYLYENTTTTVFVPDLTEDKIADTHYIIKNTKTPVGDTVDLPVLKLWNDGVPDSMRHSITMTVYEKDGNSYISPKTLVLTKDNEWSGVVTNLDPDKTYYLVEQNDLGVYKISYSGGDTENITIDGKTIAALKVEPKTAVELILTNEIYSDAPSHHKCIDAFRDGDDNPDTDLDNTMSGTEDIYDLYRLYLDAVPGQTTSGRVVRIRDNLSDNVDFYTDDLDIILKMIDSDDKETVLYTEDGGLTETGAKYISSGGVTYDTDAKTAEVVFLENYPETKEARFELSFNVKATQYAYDSYAENIENLGVGNGYAGIVGDENSDFSTDFSTNETSSEKPGFYSNDSAIIEYTTALGETHTALYEAPVIQVRTTEKSVRKEWSDDADSHTYDSITAELYMDGTKIGEVVLNDTNSWTHTFENLPRGHTYTVKESAVPPGYLVKYLTSQDGTLVISNARRAYVDIEKVWVGSTGSHATFYLYSKIGRQVSSVKDVNGNPVTITITAEDGWVGTMSGFPLPSSEETYYLVEDYIEDHLPSYPNKELILNPDNNGSSVYIEAAKLTFDDNNRAGVTVKNIQGWDMPSTGSTSELHLYKLGVLLLSGAMLYIICNFVHKRRKGGTER